MADLGANSLWADIEDAGNKVEGAVDKAETCLPSVCKRHNRHCGNGLHLQRKVAVQAKHR